LTSEAISVILIDNLDTKIGDGFSSSLFSSGNTALFRTFPLIGDTGAGVKDRQGLLGVFVEMLNFRGKTSLRWGLK
jgi:hypothetical protein